jgi:hypothetical protein
MQKGELMSMARAGSTSLDCATKLTALVGDGDWASFRYLGGCADITKPSNHLLREICGQEEAPVVIVFGYPAGGVGHGEIGARKSPYFGSD